jgi:hypothetical protein
MERELFMIGVLMVGGCGVHETLAPPVDMSPPSHGNHAVHVTSLSGSSVRAKVTDGHALAVTVGESLTGTKDGTNHTIQFGLLRETTSK